MTTFLRFKQIILVLGDVVLLYLSLGLALTIRHRSLPDSLVWQRHFAPFSFVFIAWLIVMYIADLYNVRNLKNNFEFNKKWGFVLAANIALAVAAFYFVPTEAGLAPKTNLLLLAAVFGVIGFVWRRSYNRLLRQGEPQNRVVVIDTSTAAQEIMRHLRQNPHLGYDIRAHLSEGLTDSRLNQLSEITSQEKINLIVVPTHIKKNSQAAKIIYQNLLRGVDVIDVATFYSLLFQKTPLTEVEEVWFLENIACHHKIYDALKRPIEVLLAIILAIILFLPGLIIALLVKTTSKGPLFYANPRIGKDDKKFLLYKFRSMYHAKDINPDADSSQPTWATPNDPRVTPVGQFLRATHLDEIPQLINIIKGDLSFVGPRPERSEFVEQLKKEISYYDLRHLVRPGLTGWAQIQYRYGSSVEDAYEKLQYDIYYLQNYSFWLDISIFLKTARLFFVRIK